MTMHILSAGDGYAYYTSEIATGDVPREVGRELGDYYTAEGNPPGIWMGSGLDALGVSGVVTEEQMKALYGEGLHPDAERIIAEAQAAGASVDEATAAAKLGRAYYAYGAGGSELREKITEGYARFERINHREPDAAERRVIRTREGARAFRAAKGREPADTEELGRYITAASRPTQQAVAGFDLVFSPAKSVSTLWGLGDDETRRTIEQAHEEAIADTVKYLEREAVATRAGRNGVAQIDVDGGIIATRFRHYDSRTGDPQLHDHLVVANKVKGSDGKWRTIDSKLLHRQGVAASEFYNFRVMERACDALGVTIEHRVVTAGKRPVVEIAGIHQGLLVGFSTRSTDIRKQLAKLEREYTSEHARTPNQAARIKLAQQATLDTRPMKDSGRSLAALRDAWRARATEAVGRRTVRSLLASARAAAKDRAETARDPEALDVEEAARQVVETVSEYHPVWGPHMIEAEARRYIQGARIAGIDIPEDAAEAITRRALNTNSVALTPDGPHAAFAPLTRRDGTSIYEHKGRQLFTSSAVLDAEDLLLDAARDRTVRPVSRDTFDRIAEEEQAGSEHKLDPAQVALAGEFATSSTRLLVGSGPAGTGKTTALRVAARAVEAEGGRLLALAPSAAAAQVMADALEVYARTIHSFTCGLGSLDELNRHEGLIESVDVSPGDVIVVDEAGMAGTVNLAKVVRVAELHGAHVRFIGDDRQLAAVEAGGALRLLEREVGSIKLDTIHRFRNPDGSTNTAEAAASERLRDPLQPGDPFAWYLSEGRIIADDIDRMTGTVFGAWQADVLAGKQSVMLAQRNETVAELNGRAQAFRMSDGTVTGRAKADLRDGLSAHKGDLIVTRVNSHELRTDRGRDRVKNGDRWSVDQVLRDGSLAVTHLGHGGHVVLPADYVASSVELGYASTVHRAQGLTADTSHVLADSSTTRAMAYVAMTRGKESNRLYVEADDAQTMGDVLVQIANNSDGMLSAHETIRAEQTRVGDLVTLVDQYQDVAERADATRFERIARQAVGRRVARELLGDEAWGALESALRRAERAGYDPADALYQAWEKGTLDNARNKPAVLASRVDADVRAYTDVFPPAPLEEAVPTWIVDRAPVDSRHTDPAWRAHLAERYDYLAARLEERGDALAVKPPAWAQDLGAVPEDARRADWTRLAAEIDLFRRRYAIVETETEPDAVPVDYRDKTLGAELQSRVTALHKSTVLRERAAATPLTLSERLREQKRAEAEACLEPLRRAGVAARPQDRTTTDPEHPPRDGDRARGDDGRER
jgi:conjugative relaxase-like TrwC/TraI family protein